MKKIKCYTMSMGGSKLIDTNVQGLLDYLKVEIEENCSDDETLEFEFGIEYHTQEEIDAMGEFDGF